ncbi:hypothetical protein [Mycolicibacterium lutetiense]|uniref:Uncharacterized protein n=1 Tax=Mycolicibacterium lutetiense TaxID=1641992 RepID=A0ABS5A426_9MYCO|nr:hypothetical protein [Mycolicibacterium lutetiense]MBP2456206.1 hypothetical protein [Mycolicibacterium lutetiense]
MLERTKAALSGDRRIMALLVAGWAAVAVVISLREPAAAPVVMVPMVVTLHRVM